MKMSRLDKFGASNDRWTQHDERNCSQSWKILVKIANLMGAGWVYKDSEDVFDEIAEKIHSFKFMTYSKLDEYQGLVLGRGDKPDPKICNYQSHVMKPL
jgi:predicted molibdopterin-dependent oxidoreductase YjgC